MGYGEEHSAAWHWQLLEELQPDGVRVSDLEAVRVLDDGRAARARERLAGGEPAAAVWNDLLDTLRRQRKEAGSGTPSYITLSTSFCMTLL